MYYGMRCTFDCLEGLTDDMLSCLCQHLNGHIVRYHIAVDQRPHKKSYSVSDAAGNPTSISLKPIFTNISKNSSFLLSSLARSMPGFRLLNRRNTRSVLYRCNLFLTQSYSQTGGIKYCLSYFLYMFHDDILLIFIRKNPAFWILRYWRVASATQFLSAAVRFCPKGFCFMGISYKAKNPS